jgi:hypothetical protein
LARLASWGAVGSCPRASAAWAETRSASHALGGGLFVLAGGVADPVVISGGGSETVSAGLGDVDDRSGDAL